VCGRLGQRWYPIKTSGQGWPCDGRDSSWQQDWYRFRRTPESPKLQGCPASFDRKGNAALSGRVKGPDCAHLAMRKSECVGRRSSSILGIHARWPAIGQSGLLCWPPHPVSCRPNSCYMFERFRPCHRLVGVMSVCSAKKRRIGQLNSIRQTFGYSPGYCRGTGVRCAECAQRFPRFRFARHWKRDRSVRYRLGERVLMDDCGIRLRRLLHRDKPSASTTGNQWLPPPPPAASIWVMAAWWLK